MNPINQIDKFNRVKTRYLYCKKDDKTTSLVCHCNIYRLLCKQCTDLQSL